MNGRKVSDEMRGNDLKRVKQVGRICYWTRTEVNENHYIVFFRPPSEDLKACDSVYIQVWATPDGEDAPLGEDILALGSDYHDDPYQKYADFHVEYREFKLDNRDWTTIMSQTLNEAVCNLEDKQDEVQSFEDSVTAAVDGNRRVHEGIEYELEQE